LATGRAAAYTSETAKAFNGTLRRLANASFRICKDKADRTPTNNKPRGKNEGPHTPDDQNTGPAIAVPLERTAETSKKYSQSVPLKRRNTRKQTEQTGFESRFRDE
jgi:hypothetical protein